MNKNTESALSEWLIINSQLGDTKAFSRLCEIWYPKMLRYSVRQLGNPHYAEEAVQSTFEVLTRDLHKLKDSAAFPGWAYRILHHKGIDCLRKNQQCELLNDKEIDDLAGSPSEQLVELENLLSQLNANDYGLTHLYYLEGFSTAEIATLIGIPSGTVKSRLHTIRNRLKRILENAQ